MGSLSFISLPFLAAGAICAAGPLIIHLLNRRRYRVVPWAAMDFLRQALQQNRKTLQLRDLLLLILRTLAVLFFGAALARPYFASHQQAMDDRQPLHAIIILDNSLSMAYESLEGTLFDKARRRAVELIERLPAGSQITVLPASGSREPVTFDPLESKDDAKEALARIEVVDRIAKIEQVANLARRAANEAPQLAKRIIFIGDQQELNWRDARQADPFRDLPGLQVVAVGPAEWENTWIVDLRVQDSLADLETPATVVVEVAHRGRTPRRDLQVTLSVGSTVIGQQTVTIEPGLGTREISFECLFNGLTELPEPGQAVFVPLKAAITPDRLPADDEQFVAVPIVAALPVVFVDQYGSSDEDVALGRLGETRHLRKLLAPRTSRAEAPRQLINVRHVAPDALNRDLLADARLVVVAGVRQPGEMAHLLTDFVRQGGQLFIAAGSEFDPSAWQTEGWLEGEGILPLPLLPDPIGSTPEESAENVQPFSLSFESLTDDRIFRLAGMAEADLQSLYAEPFFFKAVRVDDSPAALQLLKRSDAKSKESSGDGPPADYSPHVLARFQNSEKSIFFVSRQIGRGEVLFCSSGLLSSWNTLPKTNAILMFDRILRGMIQNTLPERNLAPTDHLTLPLRGAGSGLAVMLARPGQETEEPVDISYTGAQERGVVLSGLLRRGVYWIRGTRQSASTVAASQKPAWELPLVVRGEGEESDLTALTGRDLEKLAGNAEFRWVAPRDEINLAGAVTHGQNSWWWLALGVLMLLVIEMFVVTVPPIFSTPSPSR